MSFQNFFVNGCPLNIFSGSATVNKFVFSCPLLISLVTKKVFENIFMFVSLILFMENMLMNLIQNKYMGVVFLLLLAEGGITADICLNTDWEKVCFMLQIYMVINFLCYLTTPFLVMHWLYCYIRTCLKIHQGNLTISRHLW